MKRMLIKNDAFERIRNIAIKNNLSVNQVIEELLNEYNVQKVMKELKSLNSPEVLVREKAFMYLFQQYNQNPKAHPQISGEKLGKVLGFDVYETKELIDKYYEKERE